MLGPVSALGADEDLVDHRDRAVAPELKQQDLAGGDAPARKRPDVHIVGDQDNGLSRREAEQVLPERGGLPVGAGRVPEKRVECGQFLDRAQVEEPGRVAAAAPPACEYPVDGQAGGADCRPDFSRLRPAPCVEIALGGAVVERERCGISGSGRVGVAHDGDDAGLGQAGEARVGGCRRGWEKEGRHRGDGEKQARHRQVKGAKWHSGLLRPGKTPSGVEVRTLLKHLVRRIRRHWPRTRLTFRGDSHYGRREAMAWCEENGVDYIFGLAGNPALHRLAYEVADDLRVRRAEAGADRMRGFAAFAYAARSWSRERRVVARLEASARGFDARYIVTSLAGEPRHLYEGVYCARGQAENLIKLHKVQLASDRTSCQSPLANQFRLVLHTAAYWLMLALRDAVPRRMDLAWAEFATIRQNLLKIGARVVEKAARIRIHFASACPNAALFRLQAGRLATSGP